MNMGRLIVNDMTMNMDGLNGKRKKENLSAGKLDIPIPPYLYLVIADIFCAANFDGSVPPQEFSFFTLTLPRLQRMLENVETQLTGHVRVQGGGAQAVVLCQNFSRAMVARVAWSAFLQTIRTA